MKTRIGYVLFFICLMLLTSLTKIASSEAQHSLQTTQLDIIQQSFPEYLNYFHSSRFIDLSQHWSDSKIVMNGYLHLYNPDVIKLNHKTENKNKYKMFLFGWSNDYCNSTLPGCDAIFTIETKNLEKWHINTPSQATKQLPALQPVLTAGDQYWNQWHIGDPSVIHLTDTYFMAFSSVGYDQDGISPYANEAINPNHANDTDGYYYTIGGAYSTDGNNWTFINHPILSTDLELGKKDMVIFGTFHRPSLMYDGDRFKMWFDYYHGAPIDKPVALPEFHHSMGYAELIGPATLDTFLTANWIIKQGLNFPAIPNWPNPEIIKVPFGYLSFADPKGHYGGDWAGRKTSMAFSKDGINWKILGFIEHDSDCNANHVPEAYLENETLYLFTSCMKNAHYENIKLRTMPLNILEKLVAD